MQTGGRKSTLQHGIDVAESERECACSDIEIGLLPFDFRHRLPETTQDGWRSSHR